MRILLNKRIDKEQLFAPCCPCCPEPVMDAERGLAIRAAWLAYVGGYTQEVIAERMAISRVKGQRLVASAMENGLVRLFVEGVPAECMALEDELMRRCGLKPCVVVPQMGGPEQPESTIAAPAVAAARYLHPPLRQGDPHTVRIRPSPPPP